jgi:hypothetical protein
VAELATLDNEPPEHEESFSQALWSAKAQPEPPLLPSVNVLASAPWKIPHDGSVDVVGLVASGPIIVETVYDPATRTVRFAVKEPGKEPYCAESLKDKGGRVFRPLVDSMVHDGVVLLPSEIGPAMDPSQLLGDVLGFLRRYGDFGRFEDFIIASLYILLSWRFDECTKLPYLRLHGPPGSGKIRCLKTLASIAYRAINVPGDSSQKAMLRLLNKFGGTAIVYYADITGRSQRDRKAAIWLALGSQVDVPDITLKFDRVSDSWEPTLRSLFGPKVLATSEPFSQAFLDSLCLTLNLEPMTRTDLPINLPLFQEWHEAVDLRNKLLRYRLDHAKGYPEHRSRTFEQGISPHLQELVMPLKKVAEDFPRFIPMIYEFIRGYDVPQRVADSPSEETIVLEACLLRLTRGRRCTVGDLAQDVKDQRQVQMDAGKVGKILDELGLPRERTTTGPTKGRMAICANRTQILRACQRVGLEPPEELLRQATTAYSSGDVPHQEGSEP